MAGPPSAPRTGRGAADKAEAGALLPLSRTEPPAVRTVDGSTLATVGRPVRPWRSSYYRGHGGFARI